MRYPQRHLCSTPTDLDLKPREVWLVKDDDAWSVHCLDCGIRLGTVNAGNESGAIHLTTDHEKRVHS